MKNKFKSITKILIVVAGCLMFASFSPSLDGRAVVVDNGTFPQGLFAKTVGYLPGDIISVTNIAGDKTIDILVIGALDPSEGVAIMLSPEAAEAIGIDKSTNNIVKITKRSGQDDRVYGNAVVSKSSAAADDIDDSSFDSIGAEQNSEAFEEPEETEEAMDEAEMEPAEEPEAEEEPEIEETEDFEEAEEPEESEEEIEEETEEPYEEAPVEEEEAVEEDVEAEEPEEEEAFEEEPAEEVEEESLEDEEFEDEALEPEEPEEEEEEPEDEELEAEEPEAEDESYDEEYADDQEFEEYPEESEEEAFEEEQPDALEEEPEAEAFDEEALGELEEDTEEPEEESVTEEAPAEVEDDLPAGETFEEDELDELPSETEEYEAIVLVPADSNPPEEEEPEAAEDTETVEDVIEEFNEVEDVEAVEEESAIILKPVEEETKPAKVSGSYEKYVVPSLKDLESGKYYIQIAVYSSDENINNIIDTYGANYPVTIVPMAGGISKQILIGPVTMDEYKVVLERFKSYGFKDAFLRKVR